ncbi:MAG: hypothetical protein A3H98_04865 [Bacteroidetes bacterium RIFCSPLOWO2_02_FULL_36_8]|nr:MAG: hypothetical protein A3H98_04865 [Bacteroidetes bacterium RIFCSPLOWO2_02_FULL_36_8]OFY72010.1 MAG: hypothetical protein A3G23_00245 [Bacteroidetes bacterium RIFCSPLOWO2_12_FULL_37_12]
MIERFIHELPEFEPDSKVWEKISAKLGALESPDKKKHAIIRKLYAIPAFWRIAAVIVLCLSAIIFLKDKLSNPKEKISFSYHEEKNTSGIDTVFVSNFNAESGNHCIPEKVNNALEQINKVCQKQPEICKDTIFVAMKTQIDTIDFAINNTDEKIRLYPEEEGLLKIKTRLEQEKNKSIKKLMQYVVS